MASEPKIRWSVWISRVLLFLIAVSAIILATLFFTDILSAHRLWGMVFIFLGLSALSGKIWPQMWRAFRQYNELIKMMPHM